MIVTEVKSAGVCRACYLSALDQIGPLRFLGADTRRFAYVFKGNGVARHDDIELSQSFSTGSLVDLRQAVSSSVTEVDLHSEHVMWVAFFTNDQTHEIEVEFLSEGETNLLLNSVSESILVLRGSVTANGKNVVERNFAIVPKNTEVSVVVPEGSLCVHIKRIK